MSTWRVGGASEKRVGLPWALGQLVGGEQGMSLEQNDTDSRWCRTQSAPVVKKRVSGIEIKITQQLHTGSQSLKTK